jgi:hypothetical protein
MHQAENDECTRLERNVPKIANCEDESSQQEHPRLNPTLHRPRASGLWISVAMLVAIVGALPATMPLLTFFGDWDDEGYMLVSLTHYIQDGHLYTRTFSQYGPFYFFAQGFFFQLLRFPVTHDMGRLVTLFYWAASGLLASFFVCRISRSIFLGCAAGLCEMLVGGALASEPGHPQQVVLLLYMIAACLSAPSVSRRKNIRLFLLGCVGAALLFTKVNVGFFYIAGLAHVLVCLLPAGRLRSVGLSLTLAYAVAFPWLLMHASFNHGFRGLCLIATVGGITTFVFGAVLRSHDRLPVRSALFPVAGLLAGMALIVVASSLQGVSIDSLVFGVILNPLRHPNVYYFPLDISLLNFLAAITAALVGISLSGSPLAQSRWLDVMKCAAGIGAIYLLVQHAQIQWVVPMLPLTLMTRSESKDSMLFSRLFITLMAMTQFLEVYPVAGSQIGIAAAPMLLWSFLCIADGIAGLRACSLRSYQLPGPPLDAILGSTILVAFAGISITHLARGHVPPVSRGLRGSEWLHLPAAKATQFESIAGNVRTNCSTLFTMPGMGSFNIWSGVPTPNGWNMTAWMHGISSERQAAILDIIKADPRACAILNRRILRMWEVNEDDLAALPLAHFVMTDMPKVTSVGDYEIRVNPRRNSKWLQSP